MIERNLKDSIDTIAGYQATVYDDGSLRIVETTDGVSLALSEKETQELFDLLCDFYGYQHVE